MRRIWPLLFLLLYVTAAAIGSAYFTRLSRSSLGAYQNVAFPSPLAPSDPISMPDGTAERDALSPAVLVLVLSGLREDTSWRLASLQYVAERGLIVPVEAAVPTYGPTNWHSLFSGADAAAAGFLLPWALAAGSDETTADEATAVTPQTPSVPAVAVAAGIDVTVAGSELFRGFVAPAGATLLSLPPGPDAALAAVAQHWQTAKPGLFIAQIDWLDRAGHEHPPNSRDYLQLAGHLDAALIRFLRTFDLQEATLIIVGDHGQIASGRHGGDEPDAVRTSWIVAGPGINRAWRADGEALPQAGFAALLSGLLGLPLPAHATTAAGQDVLLIPPAFESAALARWQTANANVARWLSVVQSDAAAPATGGDAQAAGDGDGQAAGDRGAGAGGGAAATRGADRMTTVAVPDPLADGRQQNAALHAKLRQALVDRAGSAMLQRLPFTGALALVLLIVLALLLLSPAQRPLLLGLALFFGLVAAVWLGPWQFGPFYAPHSGSLSWSSLPAHEDWSGYFRQRSFEAVVALTVTALFTGWVTASLRSWQARRSKRVQAPPPVAFGLYLSAGAVTVLGLAWLAIYTVIGHQYDVSPPPVRHWLALQLLGVHVHVAGFGALAWAALAGFGGAFYLRYIPRDMSGADRSPHHPPAEPRRPHADQPPLHGDLHTSPAETTPPGEAPASRRNTARVIPISSARASRSSRSRKRL